MSHLGDRMTAMVDGELSHEARDRVLAHLTVCAECRADAEAYRSLKAQLGHLGGPSPSSDLVGRLLGLATPDGPMSRSLPPGMGGGMLGSSQSRPGFGPSGSSPPGASFEPFGSAALARPLADIGPADNRPPTSGKGIRGRGRPSRLRYALVGVVSLVALALSAGFVAGGRSAADDQVRRVAPPVEVYAVEHAVTVGDVPVTHPRSAGPATTVVLTDTGQ